jgi:hypothetical protein
MADRYWVGGTANWDATAGSKWATTSGGAGGAAVPTSSDRVFFDGNSGASTVTVATATANCSDFDTTGFTGTLAGSIGINFFGLVKITIGANWTNTGTLTFSATATGKNFTPSSATMSNSMVFNGVGGGYVLQGNLAQGTGVTLTFTAGGLDFNGFNVTTRQLIRTVTTAFNWVGGTGTLTVTLAGSGLNITTTTNLTASTSSLNIVASGTAAVIDGAGLTFGSLNYTGTAVGNYTIKNITLTGNLTRTSITNLDMFLFGSDVVIGGNFLPTGASVSSRLWIRSDVMGVQRQVTVNGSITASNIDISDIKGAGSASWNLSAITGLCGDGGGNTSITTTTPITCYWFGSGSAAFSANKWFAVSGGSGGAARAPLIQDTARFDANSGLVNGNVITQGNRRSGKINMTGVNATITLTLSVTCRIFGDLILDSNVTLSAAIDYTFNGSGYTSNIDSKGQSLSGLGIFVDMGGGTVAPTSSFVTTGAITVNTGTLDNSSNNVTMACNNVVYTGSLTRAINIGTTGTLKLNGTGTVFSFSGSGATISNGTIEIADTSASTKAFTNASLSLSTTKILTRGAAAAGAVTFSGVATVGNFSADPDANIIITAGDTLTPLVWGVTGTSGHTISLQSTSAGSAWNLVVPSPYISSDYIVLKDSHATINTAYAGFHSTNTSGNTGWVFTAPPINGTASITLGAATIAATGKLAIKGTLSKTLGTVTISATSKLSIKGSLSKTLGAVTISSAAKLFVRANVNVTLDPMTISATGVLKIHGVLNKTLGATTVLARGILPDPGSIKGASLYGVAANNINLYGRALQ